MEKRDMSATAPADLKAQFDAVGFVILRGFFPAFVVDGARSAMNRLVDQQADKLRQAGKLTDSLKGEPFETRLLRLYQNRLDEAPNLFRPELHLPGLFPVFFDSRLLDIMELMLGGEIRLYPNYSARPKLPDHAPTQVLWHQDGGYTEGQTTDHAGVTVSVTVSDLRMVNVWTPLVSARVENGCMQFVPGTHRLGSQPHERREHYLELRQDVLEPWLRQAVDIEMDPGDVVLFHNLLFHQGQPNRSAGIRWSLDWRYQDATQPTLRKQNGHIARSRAHPEREVRSAEAWARLSFG